MIAGKIVTNLYVSAFLIQTEIPYSETLMSYIYETYSEHL